MSRFEQVTDTTNLELNAAEYVQALRDRQILGLSALAGYFEDKFQPDYPNFVRVRWSRINHVVPEVEVPASKRESPIWLNVKPAPGSGRTSRNKDVAVILGTPVSYEDYVWEDESYDILPAAAFAYRGVARVGVIPGGFGRMDVYHNAVSKLVGRNQFDATMGRLFLHKYNRKGLKDATQSHYRRATLFVPDGIKIVDTVLADELPESVPLV